jgi:hypothetical protein
MSKETCVLDKIVTGRAAFTVLDLAVSISGAILQEPTTQLRTCIQQEMRQT